MYSSIDEENRKEVIDNCYWPLFHLVEMGFPIGIEATGISLEIILSLAPEWIKKLKEYILEGKIEFIGSGYSQLIGPLVPAKVNEWNQNIGLNIYNELLDVRPQVALVNEMAYSGGMVEHYINAGYEAIVMEWNNPRSAHLDWENEWRYYPQRAFGNAGVSILLIWADSIAFQKFQRFAHREYSQEEYVSYLKSQTQKEDRYFPLYSNDVEIFDYRPGRYHTEAQIGGDSEWSRIIELYHYLNQQPWCELVFPSDAFGGLENQNGNHELQLESPVQPIPVKKQEKYNINRWALTGRDDLGINSACYKIYRSLVLINNDEVDVWKKLCYLWSSDFRTHITEKRWAEYVSRLDDFNKIWRPPTENKKKNKQQKNIRSGITEDAKWLTVENSGYRIKFNKNKGLAIQELICKNLCEDPLLGTLDHGYYDDISLGADYYSGHAVIERPGKHKVTDLGEISPDIVESDYDVTLKTEQKWKHYTFSNSVQINGERIVLQKSIASSVDEKAIIRPYNFTLNPEVWDCDSLYIETHNGGTNPERFCMKGQKISHSDFYSSLISARHGFGNTEGQFIIGDKHKSISIICNMALTALIPAIVYRKMDNTFFFRLQYSALELDDTLKKRKLRLHSKMTIYVTNN